MNKLFFCAPHNSTTAQQHNSTTAQQHSIKNKNERWDFKIYYILIFFLLPLGCVENEEKLNENLILTSRSNISSSSCLPEANLSGIFTCIKNVVTLNIQIPMFPGCTFITSVTYYKCGSTDGINKFYIGDFVITDHDCNQYTTAVNNSSNNGTLITFTYNFNKQIWNQISLQLLGTLAPNETTSVLNYYTSSCVKTCYESKPKGPVTILVPVEKRCNNSCCIRESYFIKSNGNWYLYSSTSNSTSACNENGNCNGQLSLPCVNKCNDTEF